MLIDEVGIKIKAGDGGDGIVHFYHDRHRPKGGPDGGDGGDGGSVYFETVSDIMALKMFRYEKKFEAESGQKGGLKQKKGRNGDDLVLKIPVGSTIYYDNGTQIEANVIGEKIMIAKGGKGGKGNFCFRASDNQQPKEFTCGIKKDWRSLRIELKLIADVGLIGLPNAGKTSLLNELTNARAKVANYPFTTLEPNLGVTRGGKIIADIPGLIEGASSGKGLGIRFLKHIEKTKILLHCIDCSSDDILRDYKIIRDEISKYSQKLALTKEYIVLTKSDLADGIDKLKTIEENVGAVMSISIADEDNLKRLEDFIHQKLN